MRLARARRPVRPATPGRRESSEADGAPPRRFLLALVLATALGPISVQMFLPALPAIQAGFGVSSGTAQLALSASMLSIAFATLAYGPLSDRFGRRPMLLLGQGLFLVGSAVCAWSPDIRVLIAGRVVQAAGACAGLVLARAIVRDAYPVERLTSVLAYFSVAMAVFPMFTPGLGGLLIDHVHWRAVFVFSLAVGGVACGGVALAVSETRPSRPSSAPVPRAFAGFSAVLSTPVFWGYALAGAFGSAAFFAFISAAPHLVIQVMGRPASEYGAWFIVIAASFMLGSVLAARVSERIGRDRMLVGSALGMLGSGGLLALLSSAGFAHPAALFGPGALLTFCQGAAIPNAQAGAVSGDAAHAGTASGVQGFLQTAMAALFAQAVGSLQDDTPRAMIGFVIGAAAGALLAMAAVRAAGRAAPMPEVASLPAGALLLALRPPVPWRRSRIGGTQGARAPGPRLDGLLSATPGYGGGSPRRSEANCAMPSAIASGSSSRPKWVASGSSARRASGIASAMAAMRRGGVRGSRPPAISRVGVWMPASRSLASWLPRAAKWSA
jgi:MFS transporter, DHA1 family, multidrug resistance protein